MKCSILNLKARPRPILSTNLWFMKHCSKKCFRVCVYCLENCVLIIAGIIIMNQGVCVCVWGVLFMRGPWGLFYIRKELWSAQGNMEREIVDYAGGGRHGRTETAHTYAGLVCWGLLSEKWCWIFDSCSLSLIPTYPPSTHCKKINLIIRSAVM